MIIPSNSPAESFPHNTSSKFAIPLSHTLHTPLREKWKVGLMKIQIPLTFYNVENEIISGRMHDGQKIEFYFPEGAYSTPEGIIRKIEFHFPVRVPGTPEGVIKKIRDLFILKWDNGFQLKMQPNVEEINLSSKFSKLLGFPQKIMKSEGWTVSKVKHFDPWINQRVLLIHSSLVRESQVGREQYQLLQSLVPTDFIFGQTLCREYFPLDYYEVLGDNHNVISFKITDVENQPIRFRSGNVVLTLHFKRDD